MIVDLWELTTMPSNGTVVQIDDGGKWSRFPDYAIVVNGNIHMFPFTGDEDMFED